MKLLKKLQSLFPYVISLSLLVSPFLVRPWVKGAAFYDNQRLLEVFCLLFCLLIIFLKFVTDKSLPAIFNKNIAISLAVFFFCGLLSSAFSFSPRHAYFEVVSFMLLLGTAWLIATEIRAKGEALLDRLLMMSGLTCAAYILLSIAIYIGVLKSGVQPEIKSLIVGYDNHRFLNYVQTISLPMLGLLAARMPARDRRLIWWAVASLWWMLLFVAAGRATLLGLLSGVAFAVMILRRAAVAWCLHLLASGFAGLMAYLLFYVILPVQRGLEPFGLLFSSAERSFSEDPSSGRLVLWARAWEMIQADPWAGAGPAHFAHYGRDLPFGAHPHNWVLQIGSEWGLPALVCLCAALLLSFRRLSRHGNFASEKDRATLAAWWVTGTAIVVDGLLSGIILMPVSQLWIALYMGCAWGAASLSMAVAHISYCQSSVGRVIAALAALTLTAMLVGGLWPELHELGPAKEVRSDKALLKPRILSDGNF